jgi:hypothetical protein
MARETPRAVAIAAGRTTYFTGKPCKYGHVEDRYTLDGVCVECRRNYQRNERSRVRALLKENARHVK